MRMLKNDLNLEVTRGDTFSFGVEIDSLGQELESAYFTCKNNYDDENYLFQKNLNNGITLDKVEGGNYFYKVRVAPQDTISLEAGTYYYDFQIEVNDDIFTILKGVLTLSFDVTKRSGAPVPEILKVDWGNIEGDIGNQADLMNELAGKADTVHTHATSDITSGTLPILRGGTGSSTAESARTNLSVYSKSETDTLLSNKANSSNVYSKTETNTLLSSKANSSSLGYQTLKIGSYDFGIISGGTNVAAVIDITSLGFNSANDYEVFLTKKFSGTNYAACSPTISTKTKNNFTISVWSGATTSQDVVIAYQVVSTTK